MINISIIFNDIFPLKIRSTTPSFLEELKPFDLCLLVVISCVN